MKIYCSSCDKVQPVIIDNCHDSKTGEPFQDIVCKECHLVIAAGTDIQREWVGLTDERLQRIIYEHTKLNPNLRDDQELIGYIINAVRAIEAAHNIKGQA